MIKPKSITVKEKIIIRKATTKDLESILKLNLELFKKEYREFDRSLNLDWTYSKEGREYFKNKIIKKDSFAEVIENNNKIVGYLIGSISKRLFYRKKVKYAEEEDMIVDKKFRNQGLGTKLIEDFIDWCKKRDIAYISLTASVKNKSAVHLYRNLGFKDYNLTLEMELTKK